MTNRTFPKPAARQLPADLADMAFLDINDFVAAVRMSASWVHAEVQAGRAPAPVIRQSRCTRWLASDIKKYLAHRAQQAASTGADEFVIERAKKASAKGREPAAVAKAKATRKARIEARDGKGNRSVETAA